MKEHDGDEIREIAARVEVCEGRECISISQYGSMQSCSDTCHHGIFPREVVEPERFDYTSNRFMDLRMDL